MTKSINEQISFALSGLLNILGTGTRGCTRRFTTRAAPGYLMPRLQRSERYQHRPSRLEQRIVSFRSRTMKEIYRLSISCRNVVETDRLILRRAVVEDSEFILELLNDPSWLRFIGDRGVKSLDDARDYILNTLVAMYERLGFGLYLTELKGEGVPIGICGLIKRDSLEDVDLGFGFLPAFRGKGYAYETATAVMEYGKRTLGLNRIVAITSPENYVSARLLEKLGFSFERMVKLSNDNDAVSLFAADL